MKILIASCSPYVKSGYGCGTRSLIDVLLELGHEVAVYCLFGSAAFIDEYNGCPIFPVNGNGVSNLCDLAAVEKVYDFDLIISFYDIFAFDASYMEKYRWASILMIDSYPIMSSNLPMLAETDYILTVSDWAKDTLLEFEHCHEHQVIIDFNVPFNDDDWGIDDKKESRQKFAKRFLNKDESEVGNIIVFNGANYMDGGIERKNLPELIKWWGSWVKTHPKDHLHLHTDVIGNLGRGSNVQKLCQLYKTPVDSISFASTIDYRFGAITEEEMRLMYNAASVMVVPSHSEGLGMPYIEASLCGTPVCGNDWGTGGEVVSNCWGTPINCREHYYTKYSVKSKSYVEDITEAVEKALNSDLSRQQIRHAALRHYGKEISLEKIKGFLTKVENDIKTQKEEESNVKKT